MQKTAMEFQSDWMLMPEFSSWLKPDRSGSTRFGFCSICQLRVRASLQHLRRHSTDRHSGLAPTHRPPRRRQRVPKFNPAWQQLPELSGWLQPSPRQPDSAFCVTCNKQLAPKLADLRAHAASALHLRRGGRSEVPHTGAADRAPPAELSLTATGRRARAETIEMWQKRPGFGAWLRRSAADWRKAFCLFCYIELPSKWVLLVRHNESQRHRRKAADAGHDAGHPSDATEMLVLEATCDTDLPGTPWPDELGTATDQLTEQSNQDGADCETVTELRVMQPDAVNSNSTTRQLSPDAAVCSTVQFTSTEPQSPNKLTCHPPEDQLICLRPIDASDCPSVDQPDCHLSAEPAADGDQSRTAPRSYTLLTLSPRAAPNSPTAPCGDSKSAKPPRSGCVDHARYNPAWERHPELAGWLCRSSTRPRLAYCRVCRRDVVPKLAHLRRHGSCRKHAKNALRPAEASLEEALTETGTADGGEDKLDHLPPGDTPDHHLSTSTEAATSHDDQSQLVQSDILVPPDPSPPEAPNSASPTGGDSKSAKPSRSSYVDHSRYNPAWERHPELAGWLCRSSARPRLANCRVCCRDVVPKLAHLRRHGACRKHARNILRVAEASMGETGNDGGDDGDEDAELELGQSIVVKTEDDTAAMDVAAEAEVAEDAEFSSDEVEGAEEPAEAAEDDDWEDEDDRRQSSQRADGVSRSRPPPKLPLPRRRLMYLTEWESVPELRGWLSRSPWDERRPFCRWCHREVTPKLAHLRRHARSLLHKRARRGRASPSVDESETGTGSERGTTTDCAVNEAETVTGPERGTTTDRAVNEAETVTARERGTAAGRARRKGRASRTAVDEAETVTRRGRGKMKEKEETLQKGTAEAAEAVASNDATTAIQDSCRRAEFGPFGTCLVCKHPLVMRLNIFRSVTRASRRLVAAMLSTMVQRPLLEEDCDPSLSEICTACAALVDEADELQTKLAAIENNVRFKFASPRPLAEESSRHWEDGPSTVLEDAGAGPEEPRAGGSGRGGGRAHAVAEETMQAVPQNGSTDLLQEAVAFVTLGHTGEKTSRMMVRTDTLRNGDLIIYQEPVELLTQSEPPDDDMFSSSPQQRMGEGGPQHGVSEMPSESDAKPPAGRRRAFDCPFCAGHFSSSSALHRHWTREHPQRLQLACPHCPERFLYSTSLRQHVRTHQPRQHVCQVCGKRFTANCDLRKHALFAHSGGERRHACDVCGRAFTLRWMLRRHERRVHAAGDAHDDK